MRRFLCTALTMSALFAAGMPTADSCTAFQIHDGRSGYVGKNYDWMPTLGHGAAFINKRNVRKTAHLIENGRPAEWVSKYGSITFNQMAQEFPHGGINEAGLVVEILVLLRTRHIPDNDPRPAVNEAQWIQYQLDNYATVAEVIAHADELRVRKALIGTHYFVCDRLGECGVFEFVDGRLVITSGSNLKHRVLTNSTYQDALAYLGAGGAEYMPSAKTKKRFSEAVRLVSEFDPRRHEPIKYAFRTLEKVEMTNTVRTHWAMVYDPRGGGVAFRTKRSPAVKLMRLKDFDFSCKSPALALDIQTPESGHVSGRFMPATERHSRSLLDRHWMLLSRELRAQAEAYPRTHTRCLE